MSGQPYHIDKITLRDAELDHQNLVATVRAELPGLSDEDVATVVSIVRGTCRGCQDAKARSCYCQNDE